MLLSLLNIPSFLGSFLTFMTPFIQGFLTFGSWYLSELWSGLKVVFANLSVIVVLCTVALASGIWGAHTFSVTKDCPKIEQKAPMSIWKRDPFEPK